MSLCPWMQACCWEQHLCGACRAQRTIRAQATEIRLLKRDITNARYWLKNSECLRLSVAIKSALGALAPRRARRKTR